MYKNIEILDKKKHENIKYEDCSTLEVAKNIGVVPLGIDEVFDMCCISPVIISAGDTSEFITLTGISPKVNIYNSGRKYMPKFLSTYPFLNVLVQDENKKLNTIIAIDNNLEISEENKKNLVFTKSGDLSKDADAKITLVRTLDRQREIGKRVIKELKEKDLLIKKDFRVKVKDEEKIVLKEFYVIDREKLVALDDETLALWAKKGWMGIFDAHFKSLNNFEKVLVSAS